MSLVRLPPWTSYNPGAINAGPAPEPPVEVITITAVDTSLPGYPFLELSAPTALVILGDRVVQGASVGYVEGIVGNLLFLDTVTGFTTGSANVYNDTGGTPIDFATFDRKILGTCIANWISDAGVTTSSGRVTAWNNQGTLGSALNFGDPGASFRPYFNSTDSNFNNYPSLEFKGATEVNFMTKDSGVGGAPSVTAVDTFVVARLKNDPPLTAATEGSPICAQALNSAQQYPRSTDGVMCLGVFSSMARVMVNASTSLATTHLTEVISTNSEYTWQLNGTQQYTTGTNTVSWDRYTYVGFSSETGAKKLDGYMAEWFVYNAKLSTNYRTIFEYCVQERYGIDVADV